MMSVVLIMSRRPQISMLADVCRTVGTVTDANDSKLRVEGPWGWFELDLDGVEATELNDEWINTSSPIADPWLGHLRYAPPHAANVAIELLSVGRDTMIDNDHGLHLSIAEVRDLIDRGIPWQDGLV